MTEQNLKTLTMTHGGKLGVCMRKVNETRALFDAGANVEMIDENVAALKIAMNQFSEVHVSI